MFMAKNVIAFSTFLKLIRIFHHGQPRKIYFDKFIY